MTSTDGFARCTNAVLKPAVDIIHIGSLTEKQLARLPRERCARPMLPVYAEDGYNVIAEYCWNCDGPLSEYIRGPEITAAYNAKREQIGHE